MPSDLYFCRPRPKPKDEPTLFPGLRLSNRVHKSQFAAQIVGDAFEKVSLAIVGTNWRRLYPESEMDVRPDLGTTDGLNFIESKASKDRRYYKVAAQQLLEYKRLIEAMSKQGIKLSLGYFLWSYNADASLSGQGSTISDVLKKILGGIVQLDIIDWRIMESILVMSPQNTQYREYTSWRNNAGRPGYCALQISHPFMRRFRENPGNVLNEELGLNASDYDLRSNYKNTSATVQFDGVRFKTCQFKINRYMFKPDEIPQNELSETYEPAWANSPVDRSRLAGVPI